MERDAYLILQNGKTFKGKSFGAVGEVTGELVFTTAMCGYLETLTDPSYYGQIVIQTFPLIGNYGVIPHDFESTGPHLKAYIVREWCREPSNFRCEGNLDTFLKQHNIVGLYDIDTRALTRIVREYGVMNAKIAFAPDTDQTLLKEIADYRITDAPYHVSCTESSVGSKTEKYNIVLWDFGAKENIRRRLEEHGCNVITVPANATAEEILSFYPDGIMLSNGPGDPAEYTEIIDEIRKLGESGVPMFGICLGHQLLALAKGAQTEKLKYGHRGTNQPVKDVMTGNVYITSQNHGYYVLNDTLPADAVARYVNVNDGTCEGIDYTDSPAFSVQFHPEAACGPLDTEFLFDEFISVIEEAKHAAEH
jgi:carbamoyl-phosphate synthase small subunit